MASTTGIELGPDSCVLAAVRPADRAGVADVRALHVIERHHWPSQDVAVVTALSSARRGKSFPRRARVVVWGLMEPVSAADPTAVALIRPITQAGFKVERVLTPPEALAVLAASRPRPQGDGAVAWLSLNMHGAAIAIVRGTDLLFARTFAWSYNPMATGQKAQLLQRYSLVAQLAPELRRGISVVRDAAGVTVDAAITCGDLPELRSLTMPLIEELDLEVETLDSTDGLRAVGKAKGERFAESAPVVRLACAVAAARARRSSGGGESPLRFAAALALAGGLIWAAYAVSTLWLGGSLVPARSAAVPTAKTVAAPPAPRKPSAAASAAASPSNRGTPPASGRGVVASKPEPVAGAVPRSVTTPPVKVSPPPPANAIPGPQASSSVPVPVGQNAFRSTRMALSAMGGSSSTARAARPAVIASGPVPPASGAPPPLATPPPTAKPAPPPLTPGGAPAKPAITALPASPEPVLPKPPISASAAPRPPAAAAVRPTIPPGSKPAPPAAPSSAPPAVTSPAPSVRARVPPPPPPVPSPPVPPPAPARLVAETAPASRSPRPVPPVAVPAASSAGVQPPRAPGSARAPLAPRPPTPLTEPLPRIESILVDQERRLAIVDGGIVGIGDAVGQRIVTGIDRDGVVFREPSGLAIRVSLRSRAG